MITENERDERLAIDGGAAACPEPVPFPGVYGVGLIGDEEIAAVTEVLRRHQVFRYDDELPREQRYTERLEDAYRAFTGTDHALAVTGGTAALTTGLAGLGVGTGDEVIVPAYTYISSAAAVVAVGAIPIIAEVDETMTLDPADVERKITPRTKAIMPVHMRGWPCDMDPLMDVARRHGLRVIEDVAQANGVMYKGRRCGGIGDAGIFSFQFWKMITAGEGGMLVTNDEVVYERAGCKHDAAFYFWQPLKTGIAPLIGENLRMDEIRAAVGFIQFGRLEGMLARTRELKARIVAELEGTPGITLHRPADPEGDCGIAVGLFTPSGDETLRFSEALEREGVGNGTLHNKGVPDRHVYTQWDSILQQVPLDDTGYPWSEKYYDGTPNYELDACPRTMELLGRLVTLEPSSLWTDQHVTDAVRAVKKVARALYG